MSPRYLLHPRCTGSTANYTVDPQIGQDLIGSIETVDADSTWVPFSLPNIHDHFVHREE